MRCQALLAYQLGLANNSKHVCWLISLLLAILIAGLGLSTAHAAGFQKLESENLQIGIWYPSDTPTSTQRLGPFETEIALNAPVRVGHYEVVLSPMVMVGVFATTI